VRAVFSIVIAMMTGIVAAHASSGLCQSLWVERAAIYKDAGLCFKTPRAIEYFGNAGCTYLREEDVPLSPRAARRIEELMALERSYRCGGWWPW
jgi:hypothetical protein